ncbi:MAG: hypothetical protein Kow0069_13030 [Promethearchaeota archaeon]
MTDLKFERDVAATMENSGVKSEVVVPKKERFGFVDQFRGITILFFVLADVTWSWSGNLTATPPVLPVGPTWFNHGWKYYDFNPKPMITLIDIGQLLFVFVMGLMIPLAWKRHVERGGVRMAVGQLAVRTAFFYLIALVMALDFDTGEVSLESMFLTNTFAVLAAAMLGATLVCVLVPDPDKRFWVNLALLVALAVLYALPGVRQWENSVFGVDDEIELIPLNLLGATVTCVQGGVVMQWFANAEDKKVAFREKILKTSMFAWIACFVFDFFYPADHHAMNASLVLMTIGAGGFLFAVFHVLESQFEFKAPGLDTFGRNTLLVFILALPIQMVMWDVWGIQDYKETAPAVAPAFGLLSAVIILAYYYAILVPLDRRGFYFTPSVFLRLAKAKRKQREGEKP